MKRADIVAGMSVAGLMLPEAVAYAGIAGLPPARAVLAAIAGALVYALVGRSRFAIVSPTSSSTAILAAALAAMPEDAAARGALATMAVAMAGVLFLVAGGLKLGGLTGFIARPVLRGFAFGLAITIILRQLPVLFGVGISAPDIFRLVARLVATFPQWHPVSIAVGLAALAALLLLRRVPSLPGALLVLAAGISAAYLLDLPAFGVATVGIIRPGLSWPTLPMPSFGEFARLAQMVLPLALILFAESWGTMRALALRHGDTLAPDRELGALGFANLAAAAVQGMPVGAGFSAGSASEAAGARTRATAVIAAIGLALLVLIATPLIAWLPQPVLAAVVIAALTHALEPAPLLRLWKLDRDQYVALGAAIGVIALGVLNGMLFAILLSLVAMIHKMASPQLVELGRLGAHDFVDVARHPDAVRVPGLAVWRPAEPLFFANAERVLGGVEDRLAGATGLKGLVLSLEESFDIDSTALDALIEFDQRMTRRGWTLRLARVHDHVRDLLALAGAGALASRSSYSVDDAVASLQEAR
ncbi:SulP family inorganic anion transporter [Sphingomonas sp. PR090111-T3T-6A]|uniref:SulP family inorganic anion transporter n=1 Tax=Sphingomonas sp. PR090111-T3T-6A TaxID=685778 RepID=UPI000362100E|nr:SulP family inorganic anion transporter [Sphingomonas sp. PR090111-T3T-6A]